MKRNILKVPFNAVLLAVLSIMIINNRWPSYVEFACLVIIAICLIVDIGYRIYHSVKKNKQNID